MNLFQKWMKKQMIQLRLWIEKMTQCTPQMKLAMANDRAWTVNPMQTRLTVHASHVITHALPNDVFRVTERSRNKQSCTLHHGIISSHNTDACADHILSISKPTDNMGWGQVALCKHSIARSLHETTLPLQLMTSCSSTGTGGTTYGPGNCHP